jgi:hypothetical protein
MKNILTVASLVGGSILMLSGLLGGCSSANDPNKNLAEMCTLTTMQDGVSLVKKENIFYHNYAIEIRDGDKKTYYSNFKLECIKEKK